MKPPPTSVQPPTGTAATATTAASLGLDCSQLLLLAQKVETEFLEDANNHRNDPLDDGIGGDMWHDDDGGTRHDDARNHNRNPQQNHMDFGHPDPPSLQLFPLGRRSRSMSPASPLQQTNYNTNSQSMNSPLSPQTQRGPLLMVAYTKHALVAQILLPAATSSATRGLGVASTNATTTTEPMVLCKLSQDEFLRGDGDDDEYDDNGNDDCHQEAEAISSVVMVGLEAPAKSIIDQEEEEDEEDEEEEDYCDNLNAGDIHNSSVLGRGLLASASPSRRRLTSGVQDLDTSVHGLVKSRSFRDSSSATTTTTPTTNSASTTITTTSSLLLAKGIMPGAPKKPRVAVVFGTTHSHVYSIELAIDRQAWTLEPVVRQSHNHAASTAQAPGSKTALFPGTYLLEVVPRDDPITVEYMARHYRPTTTASTRVASTVSTSTTTGPPPAARVGFRPHGGVVSLSSFRLECCYRRSPETGSAGRSTKDTAKSPRRRRNSSKAHSKDNHNTTTSTTTTTTITPSHAMFVWIVYGDGTFLRLHHAAFFASIVRIGGRQGRSVEDLLQLVGYDATTTTKSILEDAVPPPPPFDHYHHKYHKNDHIKCITASALSRYQVALSVDPLRSGTHIVPLPRFYPAPLSTFMPFQEAPYFDDDFDDSDVEMEGTDASHSQKREKISHFHGQSSLFQEEPVSALLYSSGEGGDAMDGTPTFSFYTSETQFDMGRPDSGGGLGGIHGGGSNRRSLVGNGDVLGAVLGGTKAVVGGVFGALKWGLTGGGGSSRENIFSSELKGVSEENHSQEDDGSQMSIDDDDDDDDDDSEEYNESSLSPFPSLWHEPIDLYACQEMHDLPRRIVDCSIDPTGELAATADGLGRVLLIDLETKSIVRMWKGCRDSSCYWLQSFGDDPTAAPELFLVIHSRQRRAVDVWKVRHGGRVAAIQVGRDACVVPCLPGMQSSNASTCYLINSRVPGAPSNVIEEIVARSDAAGVLVGSTTKSGDARTPALLASIPDASSSSRTDALRLQHLQQLLSAANTDLPPGDILKAFCEIKSLRDLSISLDLIGTAPVLDKNMKIHGSTFHKKVLEYCRGEIDKSASDSNDAIRSNPNLKKLARKVYFYAQIVKAYDILERFESSASYDDVQSTVKTPSPWASETIGWASTFEQVTKTSLDAVAAPKSKSMVSFTHFARTCVYTDDGKQQSEMKIFFSDSSRSRKELFVYLFKPLLADVFAYSVINAVFDTFKTRLELDYIQQCFGEWFMTLSIKDIYAKGLVSVTPPMTRLLEDLASQQLTSGSVGKEDEILAVLHRLCCDSEDLCRAFMLATLCHDAVKKVSKHKERATYGKILSSLVLAHWEILLRKLRVCLFSSLRLFKHRLIAPITISNVEEDGLFSIFEWAARDELALSRDHREITSLEHACRISSYSFDPSTSAGDNPSSFKLLQNSCLSACISEEERTEYLVDLEDEDRFGSLLLFFRNFNEPVALVCNRALLLGAEWSSGPLALETLSHCIDAVQSISEGGEWDSLMLAVCLEIWQVRLSPMYRASLFGFDDVLELSEDMVAPLVNDRAWFKEFGKISSKFLRLIKEVDLAEIDRNLPTQADIDKKSWPPVREDHVLRRLVDRVKKPNPEALNAHLAAVYGMLVSDDVETLSNCVPSLTECFLPFALDSSSFFGDTNDKAHRQEFLRNAVIRQARLFSGEILNDFELQEIEYLGSIWGSDLPLLRSLYLAAMYELGRDEAVDDMLTKNGNRIDNHRFVDQGLNILCCRLDIFLRGPRMRSAEMRDTLSLLDADLCEWLHNRASEAHTLVDMPNFTTPIESTHIFALRLLSLSATANVDTGLRVKIHSLVVMSGILVKSLSHKR